MFSAFYVKESFDVAFRKQLYSFRIDKFEKGMQFMIELEKEVRTLRIFTKDIKEWVGYMSSLSTFLMNSELTFSWLLFWPDVTAKKVDKRVNTFITFMNLVLWLKMAYLSSKALKWLSFHQNLTQEHQSLYEADFFLIRFIRQTFLNVSIKVASILSTSLTLIKVVFMNRMRVKSSSHDLCPSRYNCFCLCTNYQFPSII